jgi:hypothetical protein
MACVLIVAWCLMQVLCQKVVYTLAQWKIPWTMDARHRLDNVTGGLEQLVREHPRCSYVLFQKQGISSSFSQSCSVC